MGTISRNNDPRNAKHLLTVGSKKAAVINPDMEDLSNDPYFVKKAENAKRLLDKYGVPKTKK